MNCPQCGRANPAEVVRCDCGHDFAEAKHTDFPGWEIRLAWRQKVAAFWSISWPGLIVSFESVALLTSAYSMDRLQEYASVISLGGNLVFFAIQALLTRRLVRKNYRTFRVYVVRDDGSKSRNLSMREVFSVWLWILGPQLAVMLTASAVVWLWTPEDTIRGFSSILQWLQFLIVGPYAVGLALRMKYSTFRLEAHGFRYI